ncbi:metal ABC transporter permease [Varunaivibrio sulfuroxidans]|uniref:High-affinity zinc uptake system membrane protein ZnuB n=1 Tax=Varunaivibrio sulfuroxidans TaxID=1773489 RepID=A0A4R3JDI1_9PROT|nr:metal ABC transporter permease [Varunaivibrio sulfuroxidans]TCS64099.1 zinc transport system permease protein [Varunaivibrio sulfuroxidans]WES31452.1 metal ABC transporter permease [Varunaivibrio sulfuroxidans]
MDDFLWRALLAGTGVALVAGPLGAFVVWRRMAYFGAALSHSALLGIALGFLLHIDPMIGVIAVSFTVAVLLVVLQRQKRLADDTLLGILAHGALALGLVIVAFLQSVRFDLMAYLFGDILAAGWSDVAWIFAGGAVVLVTLAVIWKPLLTASVHEELAFVEGVPVGAVNLAFMVLLAFVVALAMKVVGVLLVTSLLIIPAASVRRFSATPEAMAVLAAVAGVASVIGGLWGSYRFDTPSGPSIVLCAVVIFVVATVVPKITKRPKITGRR